MKRVKIILILCISIVLAMSCSAIQASEDSDQETSTVSLIIQPASKLSISNQAVTETLVKDSTAESAFNTGFVEFEPDKPTLGVSANKSWKLTAKSSGFTGPYSKDIQDLQLKNGGSLYVTNGFNDYKSLSSNDQEIASYNKGVRNESYPCQYKILLDWEKDIPGTYEATVTYTLSTSGA